MKRTDYLLSITSGFLKCSNQDLPDLQSYFNNRIELHELAKPGTVSIGGRTTDGKESNFIGWIDSLRKEHIEDVCLGYIVNEIEGMDPHMSAGFAGTQELVLQVRTSKRSYTFDLRTVYSPQYDITPKEFIEFVENQKQVDILWTRIWELIKESNELNNRPIPEPHDIKNYFLTLNNSSEFEFHLSQVLPEIQVEATIHNEKIIIPKHLNHRFQQSQYHFDDFETEKEYVYFYPIKEIAVKEILEVVDAQSFRSEIWEGCVFEFNQYPYDELPNVPAEEWPAVLFELSPEALSIVVNTACRVICRLCEEKNLKPVVPAHLQNHFGPDEIENKRAQARGKLNKDQWFLTPNSNPWEMYFFESIPVEKEIPKYDIKRVKKSFQKALEDASRFATDIQSPFAEAFLLGEYLISENIPQGNFDQSHLNALESDLKLHSFSEMAIENFQNAFFYTEDFKNLKWSSEKIYSMLAVSIADVFGGMGSWNDQYMETEELQNTYNEVSSNLFQSLKDFSAAVLSN